MSLTEQEIRDIAQNTYRDPVLFNSTFLPHIFPKPAPWIHRGLLAVLTNMTRFLLKYGEVSKIVKNFYPIFQPYDQNLNPIMVWCTAEGKKDQIHGDWDRIDDLAYKGALTLKIQRKPRLALIMPRGISKTMLAGVSVPLRETLFQDIDFFVYCSETGNHAKMQMENVKRELESNNLIIEVFGEKKPELRDPERWASDMFETLDGVTMVARGRGGQIRGLNHRGHRPRKVICDDLEDKESVETEHQRQKTRRWAYGDLLPSLEKINYAAELNVIGTKLHRECLLMTFKKDPTFDCIEFGATDLDGELLWPDWMTQEKLDEEKEAASLAGELETFYLEYYSEQTSSETNPFTKYPILVATDFKILGSPAIYCDPAISDKEKADEAVILVGGMSETGKIIVLDGVGDRGMTPRDILDEYFRLSKLYQCRNHGVESVAYQAALVHIMREEMFRKHWYFEVTPVTHSTQKVRRIMGIVFPRFSSGYIQMAKGLPKLETQLFDFNPSKKEQKDDWPDALAGVISLLDPYAPAATGDGKDLEKDEYEPLDDWRWA